MRTRHVILAGVVSAFASSPLTGCATDGTNPGDPAVDENKVPIVDAGSGDATDAGPCVDCEYFPDTCAGDVLCPNAQFAAAGDLDLRTQVNVIRGRSPDDVWLAGALGVAAHFDGSTWRRSDIGARESIRALWLGDGNEVSFVALERQFSRGLDVPDGGAPIASWQARPAPSSPTGYTDWRRILHSTWGTPGSEWIWGATEDTACSSAACAFNKNLRTPGLWRVRVSDTAAPRIEAGLSADLCEAISCGSMTSVHGASASTFWAVGHAGAAIRITGPASDTPMLRAFNTQTWRALHAVWTATDTDAWAVGANGIVRHYTGHPVLWDIVANVPTTESLNAVWGSSPSDVWVVGDNATVLHYDGSAWTRVKIAGLGVRRPKLTTVWVASPGHVWIGGQGVVLSLGGES